MNIPIYRPGTTEIVGWVPKPEGFAKSYVFEDSPEHQRCAALRSGKENPRLNVRPISLDAIENTRKAGQA